MAVPQYSLPGINEVVNNWSREKIKEMYHILDEASAIKQSGPTPYPTYERVPGAVSDYQEKLKQAAYPQEQTQVAGMMTGIAPSQASDLHVSDSGATSSHFPLRYDIIPRSLLERAAERYTYGATKHGERNYQLGLGDRGHILSRINHIYEHLNKLFHPDYRRADSPQSEDGIDIKSIHDNLGAILWGVGFICEVAEHQKGRQILIDLRSEGRVKTHND